MIGKELKIEIKESYLTNRFSPEALRIKLKPMKSDSCNFQKLINDQIDDMEESQILLNYNLFMDLIRESFLSPEQMVTGYNSEMSNDSFEEKKEIASGIQYLYQ